MESETRTKRAHNIIQCVEGNLEDEPLPAPRTLRQLGAERLLNRRIVEWSSSVGSYGMGGPGFFGLCLAAYGHYPAEWLALTLWGAGNWLLLDGQWVEAHPNQYYVQRPLYSNFGGDEDWDDLSGRLVGSTIAEAAIEQNRSFFLLHKRDANHKLEIPEDTTRLPRYGGTFSLHIWHPYESQLDAWVISESGQLWV